jgi:hypothetical protein
VTNDNLIFPDTREEKLRRLENVQTQLRDVQYQVMEALREMESGREMRMRLGMKFRLGSGNMNRRRGGEDGGLGKDVKP